MKKFLPYMGAAIATLAMTWSVKASAQDMFKDVPNDHWAYAAVSDLQQKISLRLEAMRLRGSV